MSTYRIYVDSREREDLANNSNTDFEIALPFSLSIVEKSLAMIDVVCVPNSILTVTENKMTQLGSRRQNPLKRLTFVSPKLPKGTTPSRH